MKSAPQYNPSQYATNRPTYPNELFEIIYKFHQQHPLCEYKLAVDLGAGTGITTQKISQKFTKTIAVDSRKEMLNEIKCDVDIVVSEVETFKCQDVDLITISTAAHWFDMEIVYKNCFEMLKPSGTLAIWSYSHCIFPDFPEITNIFLEYAMGFLEPFWDKRRGILDRLYSDPEFTMTPFVVYNRTLYPDVENNTPALMKFDWTWEQLSEYLKTWSAYKVWKESFSLENDCVDVFINTAKEISQTATVTVVFPIVLILCKKEWSSTRFTKCTLKSTKD
jgi:SAM-dependent methyltransferase